MRPLWDSASLRGQCLLWLRNSWIRLLLLFVLTCEDYFRQILCKTDKLHTPVCEGFGPPINSCQSAILCMKDCTELQCTNWTGYRWYCTFGAGGAKTFLVIDVKRWFRVKYNFTHAFETFLKWLVQLIKLDWLVQLVMFTIIHVSNIKLRNLLATFWNDKFQNC